ncbi:MAG TPA: FtsQ-type POTRA domain-containing protein [Burkholderiaceae bacterium]
MRAMRWATTALLAASALLLAGALAVKVARGPAFALRRIEVVGEVRHISRAAVRSAISGRLTGNYFTIRLDQVRHAFETLPWVAQVSVRRIWPDRLRVTLTEHRALGEWNDGRLVSDAGVLFIANPAEAEADGALVSFAGPPSYAADAVDRFHRFSALLAPLQLRIASLQVSDRASWSLTTAPAAQIELGRDDPVGRLDQRLAAIVAAYPAVTARLEGPATRIDARYSNGFAAARTR